MIVQPYLFFDGRCEEAVDFYRRTLGAEVTALMRYKESPVPPDKVPPGSEIKVLHVSDIALGSWYGKWRIGP